MQNDYTAEMIDAIRLNYPPENYSELRAALDHCLELLEAEAEGRMLVLPCKVGTPIYWINFNLHDGAWIETGTFNLGDIYVFGQTVFLTRAEAEAALKEGDYGR